MRRLWRCELGELLRMPGMEVVTGQSFRKRENRFLRLRHKEALEAMRAARDAAMMSSTLENMMRWNKARDEFVEISDKIRELGRG